MRRRPKQLSFLPAFRDSMVGPKRGTHAKTHRPLDSSKPLHVCMRSSLAKGTRTMQGRNRLRVKELVETISNKFHVRVVRYANVGNHLHLVIRLPGRSAVARSHYGNWIRVLTSRIAKEVGGAKRGEPLKDERGKRTKFWDSIPFTRVIHGRRGWQVMTRYVLTNEIEAQGINRELAEVLALEHFESQRVHELPEWRAG